MDTVRRAWGIRRPIRLETQPLLCTAVLGAIGFVLLYPLLLLILNSLRIAGPAEESSYGLNHWVTALTEPGMLTAVLNTAKLTLILQALSFPVAVFIVWLLGRTDIPGRNWIDFLFWIAFFAPSFPIT